MIKKVRETDGEWKVYTCDFSKDDPQQEIKSDKASRIAIQGSGALSGVKSGVID